MTRVRGEFLSRRGALSMWRPSAYECHRPVWNLNS
jgi:hypothetical protein